MGFVPVGLLVILTILFSDLILSNVDSSDLTLCFAKKYLSLESLVGFFESSL